MKGLCFNQHGIVPGKFGITDGKIGETKPNNFYTVYKIVRLELTKSKGDYEIQI